LTSLRNKLSHFSIQKPIFYKLFSFLPVAASACGLETLLSNRSVQEFRGDFKPLKILGYVCFKVVFKGYISFQHAK
jgi:hypothetical protein